MWKTGQLLEIVGLENSKCENIMHIERAARGRQIKGRGKILQ